MDEDLVQFIKLWLIMLALLLATGIITALFIFIVIILLSKLVVLIF